MSKEAVFFKKNKKYKVLQSFEGFNCSFENGEIVKFKGCRFVPYDELWSCAFKNKKGQYKYLVLKNLEKLNSYVKYFIK